MVNLSHSTNLLLPLFLPTKLAHFCAKQHFASIFLINCEFEVARGPRNRYSLNNSTVSVDKGCPLEMLEI